MANGQDTLTPASPESIAAFRGLDEDKQKDVLGKLSPAAKSALLMGLRTQAQAKQYGTTTGAGYTLPGEAGERRYPTIAPGRGGGGKGVTDVLSDVGYGTPESRDMYPGSKWIGAGLAVAAAPETAGLSMTVPLAMLGGAAGEAGEQLVERATGLGTPPETSKEAAMGIGKAGMATGAAELFFGGAAKSWDAIARSRNPMSQALQSISRAFNAPQGIEEALKDSGWDLQQIYSRIDKQLSSTEGRGGIINIDRRFKMTLDATKNYLNEMYILGRAAQVEAASQYGSRVVLGGDASVIRATAARLTKSLADTPEEAAALRAAKQLADNPLIPLPIKDADALAMAVNKELRKFESMSGAEQASKLTISKTTARLKHMDQSLSEGLNQKLQEAGQPGLKSYERRYQALSRIREWLEKGKDKSEVVNWSQKLHGFFSAHGINVRTHLSGLESPGSLLEEGLGKLSKAPLEEPGQFRANVPRIFEGEAMPAEEGLATTPPKAGEVPSRPGGAAPPPKWIDIQPREQRLLPQGERRAAEGASPTGTERRKTFMKGVTSAYDLPTEGEKLGESIRKARAGTPSGISEGDALKQIMKDPRQYEAYKAADQKTRDRMLIEAKNMLLKSRKGGLKPPPKVADDLEF